MVKVYRAAIVDKEKTQKASFRFTDYGDNSNHIGRQDFLDWITGQTLNMQPGEAMVLVVNSDVFDLADKPRTTPIVRNGQVIG